MVSEILSVTLLCEHVEDGENKNCGFACAWFGLAEYISILAGEDLGYCTILYFGWELEAHFFDSDNKLWSEM